MRKKSRIFSVIIIAFLTIMIYFPNNVKAENETTEKAIYINNDKTVNLYETGGSGNITFDKTTNTLTLDNYTGTGIEFANFEDQSTIKIEVEGNNEFNNGGITANSNITLEINKKNQNKKSNITMKNTTTGISLETGNINVDGVDLTLKNLTTGFFLSNGNIKITNSEIDMEDVENGFTTIIGDMYAKNITLTANYVHQIVGMLGGNATFINNKITANYVYFAIEILSSYQFNITIDNCDMSVNYCYGGIIAGSDATITNSNINVAGKYKGCTKDAVNSYTDSYDSESYGIAFQGGAGETKIDNSIINVTDKWAAVYGGDKLTISNSDINIEHIEHRSRKKEDIGICCYHGNVIIKNNSKINIKDYYYGIRSIEGGINLLNSDIVLTNDFAETDTAIMAPENITINSNISIDYKNNETAGIYSEGAIKIDGGNISVNSNSYGIAAVALEVNGGTTKINSKNKGVYSRGLTSFNNGDFYINSTDSIALTVMHDTDDGFNSLITLGNVEIKEPELSQKHILVNNEYCDSIGNENVQDSYENIDLMEASLAKKVSIVSKKKIDFDANGGTEAMDTIYTNEDEYTLPENKFFAPTGKKFKGWSLSKDGDIITKVNVNKAITVYAIWEDANSYTYKFKTGENQTLESDEMSNYSFTIDGDVTLFKELIISDLKLIRDVDYIVTQGSTIVTFTKEGLNKLNTLEIGEYEVVVKYTNNKVVTGTLKITDEGENAPNYDNPNTSDKIRLYLTISVISVIIIMILVLRLITRVQINKGDKI